MDQALNPISEAAVDIAVHAAPVIETLEAQGTVDVSPGPLPTRPDCASQGLDSRGGAIASWSDVDGGSAIGTARVRELAPDITHADTAPGLARSAERGRCQPIITTDGRRCRVGWAADGPRACGHGPSFAIHDCVAPSVRLAGVDLS